MFNAFFRSVLKHGQLTIIDASGGRETIRGSGSGPSVCIRLARPGIGWRIACNPMLRVGEAYTDGDLTIEDGTLREFFDLVGMNMAEIESHPAVKVPSSIAVALRRLSQFNPKFLAARNARRHYDLPDDLYDLFLDSDRQYSCAYFNDDSESLETAQENKKRLIAAKLALAPGMRVLDIGCGWGGMALHLARHHGARVTGVTLSQKQLEIARKRAWKAGLADLVEFRLADYRDLSERFDRIVSVGMLEHVGSGHLPAYFARVESLLEPDGVALIHAIGRMNPPGATNAWIRKHIFPGGYTPALSETLAAIEPRDLFLTDIEILRLHYAKTLKHWYDRFMARRATAVERYGEAFCRKWEFYLLGCEASFRWMGQMVFQLQLARRQDAVPLTRDYLWNIPFVTESANGREARSGAGGRSRSASSRGRSATD